MFGTLAAYGKAPMLAGGDAGEMAALSAQMRRSWAAFVHTGDPSATLAWAPYAADRRWTMVFGHKIGQIGDPAGLETGGSAS